MRTLWAPWRYLYIRGNKDKDCIFCKMIKENKDKINYIILRGEFNIVVLNKYPYTPGHLMVVPMAHIDSFNDLNDKASLEFLRYIDFSINIIKKAFDAQGFNLGVNIGKVAGAGVVDHIHMHVVPRWQGDANFMTTIGDTRVISESIEETYKQLKDVIKNEK
jgi:ATP adenylyltransferase